MGIIGMLAPVSSFLDMIRSIASNGDTDKNEVENAKETNNNQSVSSDETKNTAQ